MNSFSPNLLHHQAWTAFAWPVVVATNQDTYTLENGLALFQTGFTVDIGHLSAAEALALVPSALFFSLMRRNSCGVAGAGLRVELLRRRRRSSAWHGSEAVRD